jgi:flagellar hook-length control protein FliK
MKTSISFNPNEALTNTAKPSKPNSTQANQSSFSKLLSKELNNQKNKPTDNANDKLKNKVSNAPAKNEVTKSTPGSTDQVKKQDDTEKDTKALEQDASGTGQLLTFVENLSQFGLKPELVPSEEEVKDPSIDGLNPSERALSESNDPINKGADSVHTDEASSFASKIVQNAGNGLKADIQKSKADTTTVSQPNAISVSQANTATASQPETTTASQLDTTTAPQVNTTTSSRTETRAASQLETSTVSQSDTLTVTPLINKPVNLLNNVVDTKVEGQNPGEELSQNLTISTPTDAVQAQNFAQHLSTNTAPPATSVATDHLSPRVGTAAWNQAISQKVVWMVGGGQQTAELTLNPPDLGPMQVVISVNNDQASANFFAAQPEVREALEAALPRLRQMMSEAGVQLSEFSVNSQTSNQGEQSPGNQQQARQKNNSTTSTIETPITTRITGAHRIAAKEGLVDTFA